jgi:hypothetical protein
MRRDASAPGRPASDPCHDEADVSASPRPFGLLFAVVFIVIGALPWWQGAPARLWALVLGGAFGLVAVAAPHALAPLNRLWLRLGLVLHRVVNPIVMGVLFFGAVTPFGLVRQLMNRGLTPQLRRDPSTPTYWIDRTDRPASPMNQQF